MQQNTIQHLVIDVYYLCETVFYSSLARLISDLDTIKCLFNPVILLLYNVF